MLGEGAGALGVDRMVQCGVMCKIAARRVREDIGSNWGQSSEQKTCVSKGVSSGLESKARMWDVQYQK